MQLLCPSFTLTARLVLAFAVSKLDYVCAAMPSPSEPALLPCQLLVNSILRLSLRVSWSTPRGLIFAPLAVGDFGGVSLVLRLRLHMPSVSCEP